MDNKLYGWDDVVEIEPLWFELLDFGFECNYGWHGLIKELVQKILDWYEENHSSDKYDFKILQVKEKYGTLRFYVGGTYEEVFDIIDEYEKKSASICEICGRPGKVQNVGKFWFMCVCDDHYKMEMENN
jgi:hypothetical protein